MEWSGPSDDFLKIRISPKNIAPKKYKNSYKWHWMNNTSYLNNRMYGSLPSMRKWFLYSNIVIVTPDDMKISNTASIWALYLYFLRLYESIFSISFCLFFTFLRSNILTRSFASSYILLSMRCRIWDRMFPFVIALDDTEKQQKFQTKIMRLAQDSRYALSSECIFKDRIKTMQQNFHPQAFCFHGDVFCHKFCFLLIFNCLNKCPLCYLFILVNI